ncbi:unnamed protein product [Gongylonema pulchrum]|uniref:CA domain-containing protein n=1 Tax=Gongylonema pulchrum TaxID=637853 RepID=A0A183EPP2_9BILA|nr:unnamed protein product [Gongylonema pulchrum]
MQLMIEGNWYSCAALKATTSVKIIVLDVNDNAPQFTSPTKYFVHEGMPLGTIIGSVHAIDPDMDHNGQLQYRILPWSHPEGIFMINPIRNQIDTVEQNEFRILVEATDYGLPKRLSSATWITVVVLGDSKRLPTLKKIYHATVHEGAQVGQIVTQISNVSSSAAAVFGVMLKIQEALFSIYNYYTNQLLEILGRRCITYHCFSVSKVRVRIAQCTS